jgi:microcystin-dependent protein
MTVVNSLTPPDGWLYCRGQQVNKVTYNRLWLAIGDTYGDFGSNFGIPNFRGVFLRGFNDAGPTGSFFNGYTTGNIGAFAIDQMRQHTHTLVQRNPSAVQAVQGGVNNAADNSTVTGTTSTGTDNRGFSLGAETAPYNTCVNYLIKT